jgi:hypothetical protein
VSYFRPQKSRKIGPRSIYSLPHSTQTVSQKPGRVTLCKCAQEICLTAGVHPTCARSPTNQARLLAVQAPESQPASPASGCGYIFQASDG